MADGRPSETPSFDLGFGHRNLLGPPRGEARVLSEEPLGDASVRRVLVQNAQGMGALGRPGGFGGLWGTLGVPKKGFRRLLGVLLGRLTS